MTSDNAYTLLQCWKVRLAQLLAKRPHVFSLQLFPPPQHRSKSLLYLPNRGRLRHCRSRVRLL